MSRWNAAGAGLTLLAACGFHTSAGIPADASIDDAPDPDHDATDGPPVDMSPDSPPSPPGFCNPADLDLRGCYTFEGNTQDGSSYAHHAASAGVVYGPGHTGLGATTAASSIKINIQDMNFTIPTFTLKVSVRPVTLPTTGQRAGLIDSTAYRMFVEANGIVRCAFSSAGSTKEIFSSTALSTLVWTRVSCTYDGNNLRLFFNGAQTAAMGQTSAVDVVTGAMTFGQNEPSADNFNGAIDELQIWGSIVGP